MRSLTRPELSLLVCMREYWRAFARLLYVHPPLYPMLYSLAYVTLTSWCAVSRPSWVHRLVPGSTVYLPGYTASPRAALPAAWAHERASTLGRPSFEDTCEVIVIFLSKDDALSPKVARAQYDKR